MYELIETLAVISSASWGVLLARQQRLDFVGVFSLAFIVAFGGGTLRDLFLDRHPLFWIREDHYPVIVFALSLATSLIPQFPRSVERWLNFPDAMGLGLFTVVGTLAALDSGTSLFVASMLGVVTGTFGGVIGDVICNRVPSLFGTAPLYATCSFAGCWCLFALKSLSVPDVYATSAAVTFIVLFRLAAIRWQWQLPHIPEQHPLPEQQPLSEQHDRGPERHQIRKDDSPDS